MSSKANEAILKAIALAEKALGTKIEVPIESIEDQVREAQAVLTYFENRGDDFYEQTCKHCGKVYAYKWRYRGVAYCSVGCMKDTLAEIGISWNPGKLPHERWGNTIPALISPEALQALRNVLPEPTGPTGEVDDLDLDAFLSS